MVEGGGGGLGRLVKLSTYDFQGNCEPRHASKNEFESKL